jgi:uncharacterized protein YneF (UPF0154 family)
MQASSSPPSYEESEQEMREQAAAAMREDAGLPPSYEMSEREQYYYDMNVRMREQAQQQSQGMPAPSAPPPPSPEDLQNWYQKDLAEKQRQELQKQYQETLRNEAKYNELLRRIHNEKLRQHLIYQRQQILLRPTYYYYDPTLNDFLLMQFMLRDMPILIEFSWRLNFFVLQNVISAGRVVAPALYSLVASGVRSTGSFFSSFSSSNSSNGRDGDGKHVILLAIAAIVVMLSAAVGAVIGGYYAAKKSLASLGDIFSGKKILRSLVRICAVAGGLAGGVYGGAIVGAILGSAIPGFGTLAGAILGSVLGACISAGAGAFIAKRSMQLFSWLMYKDNPSVINPTNPDKYRLTAKQTYKLTNFGINDTSRINKMIMAIKIVKPSKKIFFADKRQNELNADYNELLVEVKRNPVVINQGVYLSKKSFFKWDGNNWQQSPLLPVVHHRPRW